VTDQLVQQLKTGSEEAFRRLVDTYKDRVYSTVLSMVQHRQDAEDVTQEVFVTVYRSILSFRNQSSLSTWIYRITVNRCLDHLRSGNRRRKSGVFSAEPGQLAQVDLQQPGFDYPGIRLEQKENARLLFAAIALLPDNQKTAFVLAHVEGLPQKEVCDIMDLSLKAVESLLQRAKQSLRRELGAIYDRRK
jgi:RNA polymerase sigma factor (sigma-70 family)